MTHIMNTGEDEIGFRRTGGEDIHAIGQPMARSLHLGAVGFKNSKIK